MAEIVVSAVITVLCEKLLSGDLMKLAQSEGIDSKLKKWKKTLPIIQAVLTDAGHKQIKERAVQLWLNDLQDLAYDIDDVLDDLATEVGLRKLNQEFRENTNTNKVLKFFANCYTNFGPPKIMYGREMSSKLDEITTRLLDLVDVKIGLGLNVNSNLERLNEKRLEQTSLVDESKIIGREGDKEVLMGKLLEDNENVKIVSIVGMGGIGKTTLAKVLYNDEKVIEHFELMAWVCVSEEFNVFNICKAIFDGVSGENKSFSTLNDLHVALKKEINKKRFLVVLDDVWNEDHSKWELLQIPLQGGHGSKIMVTARNTGVAMVMDSDESYDLGLLSNDDALSLLAQHALGEKNFEKHTSLRLHGEGIVRKCGRLPLALKSLGRVLKTSRNGDEWGKLLNSEIWDIQDGSEILPALRLSYYHLPSHLKLLFAYCSLFPKDYVFRKNELVLLWMGEGFLSGSKGNMSKESLGHQYFEELKSRSFFQHSTNDKLGYAMHDLVNDLATSVAGEFFFRLDDNMDVSEMNETFEKFRHFSLIGSGGRSYRKLNELQRARCLRTFLLLSFGEQSYPSDNVIDKLLSELSFLRVLSLSKYVITKIPQSIGSLKHLRYLNFSHTPITCLPEEVGDLYNLQSLILHGCHHLSDLKKSFVKLINLRHLDIIDTPKLKNMPLGIGGLTSLQTLTKVIIEGDKNGFKISELKDLSDLEGEISLTSLEKVINPVEAKDANLHQKNGLDDLRMEWSDVFDDSRNEMIEYQVLEGLRPHYKLRELGIVFYMGSMFPSWITDPTFDGLTELTLHGCRSNHLPTLGQLPSLEKLFVKGMNEVKNVGFELLAPDDSFLGIAFPSLEVLEFEDMKGWERWTSSRHDDDETAARSFPCLREISIKDCLKLAEVSIGLIPSLQVLHMKEGSKTVLKLVVGSSPKLEVRKCKNLVSLLGDKEVNLGISMECLKEVKFDSSNTPESFNCPNSVESLEIRDCDSLTSLTFSMGHSDKGFGFDPLCCLTSLTFIRCKNLKSFCHEHLQGLPSLTNLHVFDCPSMDYSFPCGLWPPNLRKLMIGGLKKPMSEWGQQNFPSSLVDLGISGINNRGEVSFAVEENVMNTTTTSLPFILPQSLVSLSCFGFYTPDSFSDAVEQLPCLENLNVWDFPYFDYGGHLASRKPRLKIRVLGY
ncbi:hypothetical protein Lser_V15G03291 [Lactuca serriola]